MADPIRAGMIVTSSASEHTAIVLSATPIGENDDEYVALVFETRTGERIWLGDPARSTVQLPGSWRVSESLLTIDTDLMRESVPGGLNEKCLFKDASAITIVPSGKRCQHCGERVSHKCQCGCDECDGEVETWGEMCDNCEDNCSNDDDEYQYCSVCDDDETDHDKTAHDFCDTCDDYVGHEAEDCPNKENEAEITTEEVVP